MVNKKTKTSWEKGGSSPNPQGRPRIRSSARTIKGLVERFIKRNITPNKLQAMYNGLGVKDRLNMLIELLPYCTAKQQALSIHSTFDLLSETDINKLYEQVVGTIQQPVEMGEGVTLTPAKYSRYGQE